MHCASANRAAAMWIIKRMQVDKWDADRAGTEAAALGLTNGALKTFAFFSTSSRIGSIIPNPQFHKVQIPRLGNWELELGVWDL